MTHIITQLCLRDGACVEVCPVECIIPGMPESDWPWYYIDPDTCIDCGACVPECPYEAIFPEEEVEDAFELASGQKYVPVVTGQEVEAQGGEVIDLTESIFPNYDFFDIRHPDDERPDSERVVGPGYDALDM